MIRREAIMNNSTPTGVNVQEIAHRLRWAADEDQAAELLGSLPAKVLRQVAQAYDPHFPTLRAKADRQELVNYMIRNTVGVRSWVAAWKAEQL
jgi:hypothetical protein